jgi:hypothetical protein
LLASGIELEPRRIDAPDLPAAGLIVDARLAILVHDQSSAEQQRRGDESVAAPADMVLVFLFAFGLAHPDNPADLSIQVHARHGVVEGSHVDELPVGAGRGESQ